MVCFSCQFARNLPSLPHHCAGNLAACGTVQSTREDLARIGWAVLNQKMWYIHSDHWEVMTLRWQGISEEVCPDSTVSIATIPISADCTSLITWIYWTAFGKGPDYLNNKDWTEGYTGTMMGCPGDPNPYAKPVAFSDLQPGDVCIQGARAGTALPRSLQCCCASY